MAVPEQQRSTGTGSTRGAALPTTVLVTVALTTALAVCCAVGTPFGRPAPWAVPTFAFAVAVAELAVVHFPVGRARWDISCSDAVVALVFALAPGSWMVLSVAVGVTAAKVLRHQAVAKIAFNVSECAAATSAGAWVASQALHAGMGQLPAAMVAITAFWAVQTVAVAVVVAATTQRRLPGLLATSAPLALLHSSASASVGLLAAWLAMRAPAGLVGLLVPVVLLWLSFDQISRRSGEARMFAELARGQERAGGGSVDVSAEVIVTTAARLLGGAEVTLLLFAADGLLRYDGDEAGRPRRSPSALSAMEEPWIPEVLSAGVVVGVPDGLPSCGLRIGPAERPLALLHARREAAAGAFTRQEANLARVLVAQAETWLSVADLAASRDAALDRADAAGEAARALGDLGANTAPTLSALRESAGRLARLAGDGHPEAISDIVGELHTIERTVASLLGAIALAADADLTAARSDDQPVRAAAPRPAVEEWTSTGLMR